MLYARVGGDRQLGGPCIFSVKGLCQEYLDEAGPGPPAAADGRAPLDLLGPQGP
jgi:hypothetical protein